MSANGFNESDRRQLTERGIDFAEAEAQLARLCRPPSYTRLVRPCTVGDGIERVAEARLPALEQSWAAAAAPGRFLKFVPASGAATRMFADLHYFHRGAGNESAWSGVVDRARGGSGRDRALLTVLRRIREFAFHDDLEREVRRDGKSLDELAAAGAFRPILAALLGPQGLDYEALPKGLLRFHAYREGPRTAFEEHLVEAADYVRDSSGLCRLHLTVSADRRTMFEAALAEAEAGIGRRLGVRFEVGFSFQQPATDTIAVDSEGRLLHDDVGRLRLRPGGHGSLIANLNDLRADLVFVKNIDNVQPDHRKDATSRWKKVLGGRLVELQRSASRQLERLRVPDAPDSAIHEAADLAGTVLNVRPGTADPPETYQCRRAFLIDRLHRPMRVCGVVPNTGEPGGGPFWVRDAKGAECVQIVESAQVDPDDASQQEIWRSSTHFNPVDLVCGLRDAGGEPFELSRFVDPDAAIVTSKNEEGREIRVLERPGLWNGAMAGWNTVFVEVPIETFTPVKTLLDLVRDEHRGE